MNFNTIDKHISIIISSCLVVPGKFNILMETIKNLTTFLPKSEIIIGFDKVGPSKEQYELLHTYNHIQLFVHDNGLGYTFNMGNSMATNNIILQTEDDWIVSNKYLKTSSDLKTLLYNSWMVLDKHNNCCVRLDGGMFDEIGGSNGYPLGWDIHTMDKESNTLFKYYSYKLPTKTEMDNNFWLHYAFSNHPHLKYKHMTTLLPYLEQINPGQMENDYATDWITHNYNVYYVPINEESIQICGITNPDKNIFKHIGYDYSYRA